MQYLQYRYRIEEEPGKSGGDMAWLFVLSLHGRMEHLGLGWQKRHEMKIQCRECLLLSIHYIHIATVGNYRSSN
jgi:hypothetical protein